MHTRLSARWGSFFAAPMAVWNSQCSSSAKLVFLALCSYLVPGAQTAWPSYRSLTTRTGLSEPTLRRAVRELQDAGWITVQERRREDGGRAANLYVLTVPEKCDTPPVKYDRREGEKLTGGPRNYDTRRDTKNEVYAGTSDESPSRTRSIEQDSKINTRDPVACLMELYREITGLSDLKESMLHHWLREYEPGYIREKLEVLRKSYSRVKVPLAFLSKAIRLDWTSAEDAEARRLERLEEARRLKDARIRDRLKNLERPDPSILKENVRKAISVLKKKEEKLPAT